MDLTYQHLLNNNQFNQLNLGTALANSVVLTDITAGGNTAGQAFTFPASYLQPGQQYRIRARGIVSNTGTPTLNLGVFYGGVAGVALAQTTATTTVTGLANSPWLLEADMRVEATTGTSGTVRTLGTVVGPYSATGFLSLPVSSASANSVTVDTSTAKILTIGALWGTASASNSIQVAMFTVERLDEGGS